MSMVSSLKDSLIRDSVVRMTLKSKNDNSTLQADSQESDDEKQKIGT